LFSLARRERTLATWASLTARDATGRDLETYSAGQR
jgi:hypothetical protein